MRKKILIVITKLRMLTLKYGEFTMQTFSITNMTDGVKDFIHQLPKQIGLFAILLIYLVLYILQNVIKEKLNVDITPLIQDKKALSIVILAFFVHSYSIKGNKSDGDWFLLTIFSISLIVLCFEFNNGDASQESPYERCVDKHYNGRNKDTVKDLCGQLSKESHAVQI